MKKLISITALALILSTTLFAAWAMIPLDELVSETDLIVIGTLQNASENSDHEGKGYIRVERVMIRDVNTLDGRALTAGDNLKLTWLDNWACAMAMHLRWENERGIWLLTIEKDGTVKAGHPGRFRKIDDLGEIEKLLSRKRVEKAGRVDVTPFNKYSPFQAALAALMSLGLYWVLYRSRFRIR